MLFETIETRCDDGVSDSNVHRLPRARAGDGPESRAPALGYQPVIALGSGRVVGLQVVQRRSAASVHRGDGIAERTLTQACVEARYWPGLRCSLSISARLFTNGALVSRIDAALAMAGLSPSFLEVEISYLHQDGLSSPGQTVVRSLRDRGIGIVLGNFGAAGVDSRLLTHLPLTGIKLDRRLVRELSYDRRAATRVAALLEAGRAAGLTTIASNVETLTQRDVLMECGCAYALGPLYSRPVAPERLPALLNYGVDTCSLRHSGSETRDDRAIPH